MATVFGLSWLLNLAGRLANDVDRDAEESLPDDATTAATARPRRIAEEGRA